MYVVVKKVMLTHKVITIANMVNGSILLYILLTQTYVTINVITAVVVSVRMEVAVNVIATCTAAPTDNESDFELSDS